MPHPAPEMPPGPSRRRTRCCLLAALLLLPPATGSAAVDPGRLRQLLEDGRAAEAWDLARAHRAGQEGAPRFDFYYALAAIEAGELGEAVFALRRVIAVSPEFDRARAELGHAYFLQGEYRRARTELERVLARDPPMPLRAEVERRLHALNRRAARYETKVSGYVEIGAGHDTNVNSAPEDERVETVVGTGFLVEEAREQSDDFARIGGGLRISRPVSADVNAFIDLEGERRYHDDETDFEIGSAQARGGMAVRGERTRTTLAARAQRLYLGGEPYRDVGGLDAAFRYAMSDDQVAALALGYSRLRYENRDQRDSDLWRLAGGVTRLFRVPLRPTVALKAFYGEERAALDTQDARARTERELYGIGTDLRLQLDTRWVLRGGVDYRRSEYAAVDADFGAARTDDYYHADLALEWRPGLNWRLQQRLSHAVNDSNLDLYNYDRSIAELRLRYQF